MKTRRQALYRGGRSGTPWHSLADHPISAGPGGEWEGNSAELVIAGPRPFILVYRGPRNRRRGGGDSVGDPKGGRGTVAAATFGGVMERRSPIPDALPTHPPPPRISSSSRGDEKGPRKPGAGSAGKNRRSQGRAARRSRRWGFLLRRRVDGHGQGS